MHNFLQISQYRSAPGVSRQTSIGEGEIGEGILEPMALVGYFWVTNYISHFFGSQPCILPLHALLPTTLSPQDDQVQCVYMQGFLVKQGHRVKSWKKRLFVLDNQNLTYYKAEQVEDRHWTCTPCSPPIYCEIELAVCSSWAMRECSGMCHVQSDA